MDYRSLAALAYLRTDALEVSAYLRKYDAAVSSYRFEVMKTHSYLPCEELQMKASPNKAPESGKIHGHARTTHG